jgi:hypothetical protein
MIDDGAIALTLLVACLLIILADSIPGAIIMAALIISDGGKDE